MTADIRALKAEWDESREEEHLKESPAQGKVAVSLPFLSTSSLPNLQDLLLPERAGRGCLMGWKGCSQASFGKDTSLLQAANELLLGWRSSFTPSYVLCRTVWIGVSHSERKSTGLINPQIPEVLENPAESGEDEILWLGHHQT